MVFWQNEIKLLWYELSCDLQKKKRRTQHPNCEARERENAAMAITRLLASGDNRRALAAHRLEVRDS